MGKGLLRKQTWAYTSGARIYSRLPWEMRPSPGKGGCHCEALSGLCKVDLGRHCCRSCRERGGGTWGRPQGRKPTERTKLLMGTSLPSLLVLCSWDPHPCAWGYVWTAQCHLHGSGWTASQLERGAGPWGFGKFPPQASFHPGDKWAGEDHLARTRQVTCTVHPVAAGVCLTVLTRSFWWLDLSWVETCEIKVSENDAFLYISSYSEYLFDLWM